MTDTPGLAVFRSARLHEYLNWRIALVRIAVNALALALTVLVLPGIDVEGEPAVTFLVLSLIFGVLNALVRPILQFLLLPFLFITYGLSVIVVNTLMFWLLDVFASGLISIDGVGWLILGGATVAFFSFLLENVFGLVPPIVERRRRAEGARA